MKKLTVLVLTVSVLLLSVVPVYADFTTTDSSNLSAIKSSVTSGGALYTLVNSIKNAYGSTTSSGTVLYYLAQLYNTLCTTTNNSTLRYFIQSINSSLSYDGDSVARYAFRIWNEMPTASAQSAIATHVGNIYNLLATGGVIPQQLLDDISSIDSYVSSYLYPISTAVQQNTLLLSQLRSSFNGFRTSFFGSSLSVSSFPVTYVDWETLSQSSAAPSTFYEALLGLGSLIQQPLARLAYVHASDDEVQIRENASAAQSEFDTHFLDEGGIGRIPDSSYGDIAGISSQFTSAFSTGANPSAIFNVFDSSNWGWFSQDTANSLDTTPRTRSSSNYPTPNLDAQIEAILSLLGGD